MPQASAQPSTTATSVAGGQRHRPETCPEPLPQTRKASGTAPDKRTISEHSEIGGDEGSRSAGPGGGAPGVTAGAGCRPLHARCRARGHPTPRSSHSKQRVRSEPSDTGTRLSRASTTARQRQHVCRARWPAATRRTAPHIGCSQVFRTHVGYPDTRHDARATTNAPPVPNQTRALLVASTRTRG